MKTVQLSNTSYVLRLTKIRRGDETVWRFVLIPAGSQEELSFRDLADLVTYIQKQTAMLD